MKLLKSVKWLYIFGCKSMLQYKARITDKELIEKLDASGADRSLH